MINKNVIFFSLVTGSVIDHEPTTQTKPDRLVLCPSAPRSNEQLRVVYRAVAQIF